MNLMDVYNRLPIVAQNLACSYEGRRLQKLRYGGIFESRLAEYNANLCISADELIGIRNEKLACMVRHCYENVPFYTELFDEYGIDPYSVRGEDDIKRLPILDKQTVRARANDFRPKNLTAGKPFITEHTSGSTGSSLIFEQSVENVQDLWAVFWRFWGALGIERDTLCADFGSRTIVPPSQKKPPFWRECSPLNQVKFSAFHANESNYAHYARCINDRGIEWIHGYPSCIVPFADYVVKVGFEFRRPIKWVTTSAENLYPHQRKIIEAAFGVQPNSLYALTEATACISESKNHEMLVDEDYSLVEFVPEGDLYRIVGSNLSNYAFPLLRYDTGDLCSLSGKVIDGRRKVEFIDGRNAELIRLPDGGTVGALSALFTESNAIKEAQLIQHADLSVTAKFVVRGDGYQQDIEIARSKFLARTRGLLPIEFVKVDSIERTARGKLRYIISEVSD